MGEPNVKEAAAPQEHYAVENFSDIVLAHMFRPEKQPSKQNG